MKLLIQPADGVGPLIKAIRGAKRNIDIVIFRFDQREIERALAGAVTRGVAVNALIAHTNRAGEENLRQLEMRLLEYGITVSRTADDLVRYHGKLMVVDRRDLYLLAFNLTIADIEHSRSFGIITQRRAAVAEAGRLFEADSKRSPYEPTSDALVVSPANARRLLAKFIAGAKKELLIYDPKVGDRDMIRMLQQRAAAGVEIRIIGKLTRKIPGVRTCKLAGVRLHTRTMVRDGSAAFVGSQSLRPIELDARREVGLIFRESKLVARIREVFNQDWSASEKAAAQMAEENTAVRVAKKVAKAVAKDLPPVTPMLNGVVKEIVGAKVDLDPKQIEEAVKGAIKTAVKAVVSDIVEEVVEEEAGAAP